jgi:hypothetical protein
MVQFMNEKRAAQRNRVLRAGKIEFGSSAINCMVRNITELGAMIDVTSSIGIPDRFTLSFQTDGQRKYCQIVWRNDKRIGVAFD